MTNGSDIAAFLSIPNSATPNSQLPTPNFQLPKYSVVARVSKMIGCRDLRSIVTDNPVLRRDSLGNWELRSWALRFGDCPIHRQQDSQSLPGLYPERSSEDRRPA